MHLSSMRMRIGAMIGGAILVGGYFLCGGELVPGSQPTIVIQFGAFDDAFVGADVEIDGEVVGQLRKFGQATKTGFPVDKGEHTVRVLHPDFTSEPTRVEAKYAAEKIYLMLEMTQTYDESGGYSNVLVLQ